jgi:hypothetical protein
MFAGDLHGAELASLWTEEEMFNQNCMLRRVISGIMALVMVFVALGAADLSIVQAQEKVREETTPLICPSTLVFGDVAQCSILTPAEGDSYAFAANSGDKILVRMSKSSGTLYPEIRIYSPGGLQLCQDWDYTTSEIASCMLTETGTYSILVGDYGGTKTGDYYLYLQRLNGPGSPLPIAFGQTLSGSILMPAEMDTHTFAASAGDKVIVRMTKASGTLYPEIRVYSPGGLKLCQDWDYTTSEIATCTLTETGTYSILVGDYGGTKTGDYYLYLQRLNDPGSPLPLAFGQTLSGSILMPAEMDTYTFAASAGDKVTVRMAKASGTLYPEIRVYSPTGLQLCQDWDYTTSEIPSCTLTANGVYSILGGDYGGTKTGDYYIYLQLLNNPGNATSIGFGQTLYGSIVTPAEMDAYKFTVRLSGKAIIRMSKSSGTLYPEIRVYGPTGLQLCQDWDYTTSEIASCTLTDVGSYLILAGDYGGTKTGDYYLFLQWLNTTGNPVSISGNAGAVDVTLKYLDGTPQSVLSDAGGFYSITVPSGWGGRVTPSKTGVIGFVPAYRDYTTVIANQTAQDYKQKVSVSFKSVGARDGWILETTEIANTGQALNVTASVLRLGDDAARKQYRSILSFATGSLPDGAIITKVTLKVKQQGIVGGGDPVNAFQGFMVDVKQGTFGAIALQASDWQAAAQKTLGPFTPVVNNDWYVMNLTPAKVYINLLVTGGGLTQIRLRFKIDDNNNAAANYLSLFSGEAATASRPQLIIEYYIP